MSYNIDSWLELPIEELGLSSRIRHILHRHGIETLGILNTCLSRGDLQKINNVGEKTEAEIITKFHAYSNKLPNTTFTVVLQKEENQSYDKIPEVSLSQESLYPAWHYHPTSNLCLPTRIYNLLDRNNYKTLGQIVALADSLYVHDIHIKGFGPKNLKDLKTSLSNYLASLSRTAFDKIKVTSGVKDGLEATPNEFNPEPISCRISNWLNSIPKERAKEVINLRCGLKQEPLTLEEVGQKLGLTRERVRQIEQRALIRLNGKQYSSLITELMKIIESAFDNGGSILTSGEAGMVIDPLCPQDMRPSGLLKLLAQISDEFYWDNKRGLWVWGKVNVRKIQLQIMQLFESVPLIEEGAFIKQLGRENPDLNENFLRACLRTHPDLECDKDGMILYKNWNKRRTGVIILALRKIGRPAHFTEITETANQLLPLDMQANAHNIHAHIQRMTEIFVRVGRGTYGLAEAGLERSEFYPDILERVLRECGHPLPIQEILTRVCDIRDCKESTIFMLLTLNRRFRAFPGDVYGLAEWNDNEFYGASYREQRLLTSINDDEYLSRRKPKPTVAQTLRDIDSLLRPSRPEI